jgi:hypothetical protein
MGSSYNFKNMKCVLSWENLKFFFLKGDMEKYVTEYIQFVTPVPYVRIFVLQTYIRFVIRSYCI